MTRFATCHPSQRHYARGLCVACYAVAQRRARGIGPKVSRRTPPETRFWTKVEKTDGCWLWRGKTKPNGYGGFENTQAHRAAWLLSGRTIPDGHHLDHLCRVRLCVNPDHLEPVTPAENLRRAQPIHHYAIRTHCKNGHPFAGENLSMHGSTRICRTCVRAFNNKAQAKRRAA